MENYFELKIHGYICSTQVFTINGIYADSTDFGDSEDTSPETAEDYSCGNRVFIPKVATEEVLNKYKINNSQFEEIQIELIKGLSFGKCGWCS